MMATTDAEMLVLVNAAITTILGNPNGQMSIGDRSYTRHDLGDLREWREALVKQIAADTVAGTRAGARHGSRVNFSNFS